MTHNVWRDQRLHVMARKCSTCIYRPGNLMDLTPGRREQMEADSVAKQGVIACHKTLGSKPLANAVCRGYYDTQKDHVGLLSAAERMELVIEVEENDDAR